MTRRPVIKRSRSFVFVLVFLNGELNREYNDLLLKYPSAELPELDGELSEKVESDVFMMATVS